MTEKELNFKLRKQLVEFDDRCRSLERTVEMQNKTIWTYQKFFLTFQEELKPVLIKWKKLLKHDVYVVHEDPVTKEWKKIIEEVRCEEREKYRIR